MKGLKKTAPKGAQPRTHGWTDKHGDSMTESAQLSRFSEKELEQICIYVPLEQNSQKSTQKRSRKSNKTKKKVL